MARHLDELDQQLLNRLQDSVPLTAQPFAELAAELHTSEKELLERIEKLKTPPHAIIRQISAIFDTKALGYASSLVAARIEAADLARAAAAINTHPGVTHNYQRNHPYNLWYTVAVPPNSALGLEKTVQKLHDLSGAAQTRLMPTLKLYKIGVKLNLGGEDLTARGQPPRFGESERREAMSYAVTPDDQRMIRVLQQDLPLLSRPYDQWAAQAGVSLERLLDAARQYQAQKRMRRFSAVLHHREAGFAANGMGVWNVPPERQEAFGTIAAGFAAVSHCYLRPTYEDWPYSIFTMVHAPKKDQCDRVLQTIAQETAIADYAALYSMREFKKTRVQYFDGQIERWENQHAG